MNEQFKEENLGFSGKESNMLPVIKSNYISIRDEVKNSPYPDFWAIDKLNQLGKIKGCAVCTTKKSSIVGFRDPETNNLYKAEIVTNTHKLLNIGDYIEFYLEADFPNDQRIVIGKDCNRLLGQRVHGTEWALDIVDGLNVSTSKIRDYGLSSGIYKAARRMNLSTREFLDKAEREHFDISIFRHIYIADNLNTYIIRQTGNKLHADKYVNNLDDYLKYLDLAVLGTTEIDEFLKTSP